VVKCNVCDQEVANSEELKRHQEQMHPIGEDDDEKPDLMENPLTNRTESPEHKENEMPEATEQRNR
jgi:hypothetical protein